MSFFFVETHLLAKLRVNGTYVDCAPRHVRVVLLPAVVLVVVDGVVVVIVVGVVAVLTFNHRHNPVRNLMNGYRPVSPLGDT